ncbi:pentapeptide repeat-containing protein [Planomonospora sp. ID67723]|uniref:pentapeptide repeat-containing protein n=1 Tax=Planomonospora sp. ID67723 TaxID=2738134 RepID=UPI0018C3D252|nr:pentapeptide repeat-containing protein [Planomonospora sp. ID67723]MBG0832727.1 pentapeptide repeat-containing protein [Planomonospora sp. ID67723]
MVLLIAAASAAGVALPAGRAGTEAAPYVPAWSALALTAVVLATTGLGLALGGPRRGDRTELRVLSWWWVLTGVVLIVVSMWGATAVLLTLADTAPDAAKRVELRLDAVKTGLTVGAGAAGLVALLLGVRRQWLGERTQAYQEYDAAEKRVTELYTKAADQLGHDKAAVRLAGLYALERVAQHNPEHRQTIVDVICAYLRMPPVLTDPARAQSAEADGGPPDRRRPDARERELRALIDPQELQVRIAAQRILRDHLRWSRSEQSPPATFWPGIDLDLTGAWLVKLDLIDCRMRGAGFGNVVFEGFARFDRAAFGGRTMFAGAVFTGTADWDTADYKACFQEALFEGETVFRETVFAQRADFRGVAFTGSALFSRSVFRGLAVFRGARFGAEAFFSAAAFAGEAVFREAEFSGPASFQDAAFDTAPALWEARVHTAPGILRSWPPGWREVPSPDGSSSTRLIDGAASAGEPPVPDHTVPPADAPDVLDACSHAPEHTVGTRHDPSPEPAE